LKKRQSLVQKVFCLWNSSQVHGRGHLLSKINGKVNIWTITSFSSLHKWFQEEISLYSQIRTVMQLLTKIYIKRIKLIHDYLCCYPKPDWLELKIFFFYKWMEKRKAKSRDNHKWQKPSLQTFRQTIFLCFSEYLITYTYNIIEDNVSSYRKHAYAWFKRSFRTTSETPCAWKCATNKRMTAAFISTIKM